MKHIKREDIPTVCPECEANLRSYHGPGFITSLVCSERCSGYKVVVTIDHSAEAHNKADAIMMCE